MIAIVASSILTVPHVYAATGSNFDNVVVIAMENQNYVDVMGTGTGSSNAPFIGTVLNSGHSATYPNYHSYGNGPGLPSISGCSAACYVAFISGSTQGVSDGYCCITHPTLTDRLQAAGLTWQAYCESGCGRGPDHFPFYDATGALLPNTFAGSSVSTANFVAAANSATPPNFLWFTPSDSHNMHDNSIATGDSYLQTFLVGSGSLSSPSPGSLLASSLFQPGHRTLLMLWWDEYDPSPQLLYSPTLLSSSTIDNGNSYMEYSWLHLIESNWGLPTLTSNDAAAVLPAVFAGPQPLTTSFSFTPSTPVVNLPVAFTSTTAGGQGPYTIAWNFGDGSTGTGLAPTHIYTATGSVTITETATDSSSPAKTASSSKTLTISPPQPLATSFTFIPTSPTKNTPVTFTAVTTGGMPPYSASWTFGDGGTGSGTVATHTYTSAGSFTITETAKDSSAPQQTATASQTITVFSSLTGNFGSCASLPGGWNCGNTVSGAPSPTSAQIVSGVFESRQSNPGLGGSNNYYYSTTQKGTFPWTPCSAPATGVIPAGITSVSVNFTSLAYDPGSSPSADRYHIYIALYYWLPNGPVTAGGSTYQCLDTQVRVENVGGSFSPIGSTAMYNPGDSFGWDNVTLQISPGQTGLLVANVANQCLQDLQAYGIPTSTPCQLAGIEIGTEGYQFRELDVNWYDVSLNVGPVPPSTSFTASPASPIVNTLVTFTSSTFGGTPPYMISWSFGDGSTGSGSTVNHTYSTINAYTVTETAKDSASPQKTATSTQTINVRPIPPLSTSFTFVPQTPLYNTLVTFTSTTTGGTSPYTISWSFGDSSTGTGASVTHTFATSGSYTVTETATDAASPAKTVTATQTVIVYLTLPLSASFSVSSSYPQVGQTITFTATATGGTSPYTFIIDFGDGSNAAGTSVSHAYSSATSYRATLTVTDSATPQAGVVTKTLTIIVRGIPPALTVVANQTVTFGTWINFTVTGASNAGGTVTLSATGLPPGASFDPTTGAFSWKPSSSQTGTYVIVFTATDNTDPSTPTSKPMQIQVNQASPGGSNGGNGGSGGSSGSGCFYCGVIPRVGGTFTLLVVGGLLGLVFSLALLTFRARASLEQTKSRMRRLNRE